jgi:hypothetical protein
MPIEQDVVARLAELDLVVADLTRANERVATVERRNVSPFHLGYTGAPAKVLAGGTTLRGRVCQKWFSSS